MGNAALLGFGSGGNQLNYKVVLSSTQPSSPSENTIWLETSTSLSTYKMMLVKSKPTTTSVTGRVFMSIESCNTLSDTTATINAIKSTKGNELFLKLGNAYVCTDGSTPTWELVNGYIYKSDTWIQFSSVDGETEEDTTLTLFDGGDNSSVTGGWTSSGYSKTSWTFSSGTVGTTLSVSMSTGSYQASVLGTKNKVDLSSISTLYATIDSVGTGTLGIYVDSDQSLDSYSASWSQSTTGTSPGTVSIDVSSLTGSYYVVLGAFATTNTAPSMTVSKIWGE